MPEWCKLLSSNMASCSISHSPFPAWFPGSTLHLKRRHHHQQLLFRIRKPTRKQYLVAACASSIKRTRSSKKLLTDSELRLELHQFVSDHHLPENHVPSFNDLAQRGRKDLAFIVRRRGYKYIRDLLENSGEIEVNELEIGEDPIRKEVAPIGCDVDEKIGQRENGQSLVGLAAEVAPVTSCGSGSILGTRTDIGIDERRSVSPVSLLQEKVANFIQSGELEYLEDENTNYNPIGEGKRYSELDNASSIEREIENKELSENNLGEANDTLLSRASKAVEGSTEGNLISDKYLSTEGHVGDDSRSNLDSKLQESENEAQVKHLKFMLHQKELELSQLKEQIEKEKLQLSIMQTKAETEIGKAQKLISEKDEELNAAEESLAGLKEVQIQYCVDGETVEVSGSFNGWHHRIKMDPDASAIVDPMEPRKPQLWSATLWLYPGVYEIKFIVDGQWITDPERESVTKGTINNNILRVER